MFVPLGVRAIVQFPDWAAITWMVSWASLGYVFAPYGMWKQPSRSDYEFKSARSKIVTRHSGRSLVATGHDRLDAPCVIDGPINGESFLHAPHKNIATRKRSWHLAR
jgi:hypothetical protein